MYLMSSTYFIRVVDDVIQIIQMKYHVFTILVMFLSLVSLSFLNVSPIFSLKNQLNGTIAICLFLFRTQMINLLLKRRRDSWQLKERNS